MSRSDADGGGRRPEPDPKPDPKPALEQPDVGPDAPSRAPSLSARVLALERLSEDRWARLDHTLSRLEAAIDRMDRRMWLAASACAAAGFSAIAALAWRALG